MIKMKKKLLAALLLSALTSYAFGQTSVKLCSDATDPDCVDPHWGQVNPELTGGGGNAAAASAMRLSSAPTTVLSAKLIPVAAPMAAASAYHEAPPKALLEGTQKFTKETEALATALKNVEFDHRGRIVKGQRELAAATAAAQRAAAGSGYTLTLYIKPPEHLNHDRAVALNHKLVSINKVLATPVSKGDKPSS
jgi:hypothetical protein